MSRVRIRRIALQALVVAAVLTVVFSRGREPRVTAMPMLQSTKPALAAAPDSAPFEIQRVAGWLAATLDADQGLHWPTTIPTLVDTPPPDSIRRDLTAWAFAVVAVKPGLVRFHAVPRAGTTSPFRFCDVIARASQGQPGRLNVLCLGEGRVAASPTRRLFRSSATPEATTGAATRAAAHPASTTPTSPPVNQARR